MMDLRCLSPSSGSPRCLRSSSNFRFRQAVVRGNFTGPDGRTWLGPEMDVAQIELGVGAGVPGSVEVVMVCGSVEVTATST